MFVLIVILARVDWKNMLEKTFLSPWAGISSNCTKNPRTFIALALLIEVHSTICASIHRKANLTAVSR